MSRKVHAYLIIKRKIMIGSTRSTTTNEPEQPARLTTTSMRATASAMQKAATTVRSTTASGSVVYESERAVHEYLQFHFGTSQYPLSSSASSISLHPAHTLTRLFACYHLLVCQSTPNAQQRNNDR